MAADPCAQLFYGVLLDKPTSAGDAVDDAIGKLPVEIVYYGETPNERLALAAKKSKTSVLSAAKPVKIMTVDPAWDVALRSACKALAIAKPKLGWFLAAHVGW
jgi:hypothetical protein